MKKILVLSGILLIFVINSFAQESIRTQLFGEVENLIQKAKKEKVDIFSPVTFKEGYEKYQDALQEFKNGGNLEGIRAKITDAKANFKKAFEFTNLAHLSFESAISSRNDAIAAKAEQFATETWKDAEEEFKDAMGEMEDNDLEKAKKIAGKAEALYRKAELQAIENNLLNPAKELLKEAKDMDADDYAPVTFKQIGEKIKTAEKLLQKNRYDRSSARQFAEDAKYEAQHAIYITKLVKMLEKKDNSYEELILANEKPLYDIAQKLGIDVQFVNGPGKAVDDIRAAIDSIMVSREKYQNLVLSENKKVGALSEQIKKMETRLGKFTSQEEALKKKIALKEEQDKKIKEIAKTITRSEGQVLIDGDDVIIRLYGLNFPTGKATIRPANFKLLKKVQDGIKNFQNCKLIIEGHTDSRGSKKVNQKLSEERANAVMKYLMVNMNFPKDRIQAKGYGSSKPVASNATEAGRAKNRRIDVVIIPQWAQN